MLCYALPRAISIYYTQSRQQAAFEELKVVAEDDTVPDDGEAPVINKGLLKLQQENADFVGWLTIEDTIIDYPVMKSSEDDPEFYLRRDFDKNYAEVGTLFIGADCDADSQSFIIYGHKVSTDTMFGTLDRFADYQFADTHQVIDFSTPYENRRYRVFAAFQARVLEEGESGFKYYDYVGDLSRESYEELVQNAQATSLVDIKNAPTYPQQIIMLSTCSYHTDNGRFVVLAYRES